MAANFELKTTTAGKFLFNLKAGNGEVILTSQQYESKSGAEKGIDSVRNNATLDERFERKTSKADEPYFVLNADYARAEPADSERGRLIAGLQNGQLGYRLVFRFRRPAPLAWLPGRPRDLVGERKERPITSVLRQIDPWYEVFIR